MEVGGLERVVCNLCAGLRQRDIDCYLACLYEEGEWGKNIDVEGCWTGKLGQCSKTSALFSLRSYVKTNRIDILHSHNPQPHLWAILVSKLTGRPVVHTKHGRNYPGNSRRVRLNRFLSSFTKRIVAVSRDVADVAVNIEGVPSEKVTVIHNGIDISNLQSERADKTELRKAKGIPPHALVVGSVGRLSHEKNYGLLVEAFGRISTEGVLVLVGDGSERKKILSMADKIGIRERIIMPGMRSDVYEWLSCMDVFCLSSVTEGTPLTLLEAGQAGLPCVVTDVGGCAEIVEHGVTGKVESRHEM